MPQQELKPLHGSLRRCRRHAAAAVAATALLAVGTARAEEIVVQNDSVQSGDPVYIQLGFIAGESAAAWLTSPCDGNIVAVQILWLASFPTGEQSVEDSITIYSEGSFPFPGLELALLEGPVMTEGYLNEFRYLDEQQTIPINIPIQAGETFIVSFKFFNNPAQPYGPSVVTDIDGCQNGKNAIFAIPGGWLNPCPLGVSGDFVIRAVVDCQDLQGACCLPNGDCIDGLQSECATLGGEFQGAGTECATVNCPQPAFGACCFPDASCQEMIEPDCIDAGGDFQGDQTDCATVECPLAPGACCIGADCFDFLTEPECISFGGFWQGPGSLCANIDCSAEGACCIPASGGCLDLNQADCATVNGIWQGPGTECATVICFPEGACCLPDGSCQDGLSPDDCDLLGGAFQGDQTECATVECPETEGACCLANGNCIVLTEADCAIVVGTWAGAATDCSDNNGNGTADACENECPADVNGDDTVNVLDLLAVLAAWGATSGPEDINGDGVVNVLDMLEVLSAWGPCA
jgi:hypothetical protein